MRDISLFQIPGAVVPLSFCYDIIPWLEVNMATENTIDINAVLADLIAQRDRLTAAIDALQALQGGITIKPGAGSLTLTGHAPTVRSDEFFGMTVLDGAKKFLGMTKRPQNARAVTEALQKGGYLFSSGSPITTVASVLNRALEGGGIVRPAKGMFGLAEWYPQNRSRRPRQNDENDTEIEIPSTDGPLDGTDV